MMPAVATTTTSLVTLVQDIRAEHKAAQDHQRQSVEHAIRCGELLLQAKTQVGHGGWTTWLAVNVKFSETAARGYMRLAGIDETKRQRVADLTLREALNCVSRPYAGINKRIEKRAVRELAGERASAGHSVPVILDGELVNVEREPAPHRPTQNQPEPPAKNAAKHGGPQQAERNERFVALALHDRDAWEHTIRMMNQCMSLAEMERFLELFTARIEWRRKMDAKRTEVPETMTLRSVAALADGTELHPQPIIVCGEQVFPQEYLHNLTYQEAYMYAHLCRELVKEISGSVKEVGMAIAHIGRNLARQFPDLGAYISAIGTRIQARGGEVEKGEWFRLESWRQKTRLA